ncbi:esterase-like activity of phytase family protein [Aquimarina sp. 2201CG1-2-11]|uniref:esterase-like activity of phytase family protein n=1 Tax=Aquimarina discodermiae TaxID=3231043 RepID=UPI003461F5E3
MQTEDLIAIWKVSITPDEKILVGIMQSTLYNPVKIKTDLTRIVTFNLNTGKTKQYLYRQEKSNLSNSEIVALSNTEFLVVERDGKFSGAGIAQKRIYKIDLSYATDVTGEDIKAVNGLLINGKTIEESSWEEIKNAGIQPVSKILITDLVSKTGYPHDKLEGVWLTLGC